MYHFETDKIRERKHLKKLVYPVIRSDQKSYKSINHARLRNGVTWYKMEQAIKEQTKINGYLFDYQ